MGVKWGKPATGLDAVTSTAESGFDFAELTVDFLMNLSDKDFLENGRSLKQTGLSFEVFSGLLPPGARVTEQGFNIYVWSEYLKRAFDRVAELGGRKVVWSDGRSRVLPVEGEVDASKRQALQFLFMVSELAEAKGMDVLVEPLDPRRTNFLNSISEVKDFLGLAGKPNLSSVISLRDLDAIGLDAARLAEYADLISHIYLENPAASAGPRQCPRPDDGYDYSPFLDGLKRIDYSGCITLPENADAGGLNYCRNLSAL